MTEPRWFRTRPYLRVLGATVVLFAVYQATIVAVPYAMLRSGGTELAAGGATTFFMAAATVSPLLAYTRIIGPGSRRLLAAAATVHAVGTFGLTVDALDAGAAGALLHLVRGASFGVLAVGLGALCAETVEPCARGRAMGLWGLVATIPAAFAPPVALALVNNLGPAAVLGMNAALALVIILLVPQVDATGGRRVAFDLRLLVAELRGSLEAIVVFAAATLSYGVVLSFAADRLQETAGQAGLFFGAMGLAIAMGRRIGGGRLALSSAWQAARVALVVLAAVAFGLGADISGPAAVALLGVSFGLGFGIVTTMTHVQLVEASSHLGAGNALFSAVFNAGIALGGLVGGVGATAAGVPRMFWITGAIVLLGALAVQAAGGYPAKAR